MSRDVKYSQNAICFLIIGIGNMNVNKINIATAEKVLALEAPL